MRNTILTMKKSRAALAIGLLASGSLVMAANYNLPDQQQNSFDLLDQISPQNNEWDTSPSIEESLQQSTINKAENAFLELANLLDQHKLDEAEKKITSYLKQAPDEPELYNLQGFLESLRKDKTKANKNYQKALSLDKNNINAHLGLARLYMETQEPDKASDLLNEALSINQKTVKAYLLLADIANNKKNYQEVETVLQTGLEKVKDKITDEIEFYNALEIFYGQQKQPEKILVISQDIVSRHPNDTVALSKLVRAQLINDQKQAAEQTLRQIISLDKQVVSHRFLLAKLLSEQPGKEKEVIKLLDETFEIAPGKPQPLLYKGAYLIQIKSYQEALDVANKLETLFPKFVPGQVLKGNVYLAEKKFDKALEIYQQAYLVMPYDQLLFSIVDLMNEKKQTTEAIKLLDAELKKNNKNPAIHFKLATLFQQQNDYKNAELNYQAILDLLPDNEVALNNLAWLYSQKNNPQALELATKAYSRHPESAAIADTYGYILVNYGKPQDGLEILKKATALAPNNNTFQFHLAEAYSITNNKKQSMEILENILKSGQEFPEKQAAIDLLNKLR